MYCAVRTDFFCVISVTYSIKDFNYLTLSLCVGEISVPICVTNNRISEKHFASNFPQSKKMDDNAL